MYMQVKRLEVVLEDSEHQIISAALIGYATKDVQHWKQHGYASFLENNKKEISMARDFALGNQSWIDDRLKRFEKDISEKT